jgi:threonylcarbamoyladenosine tRNA methylthiotransferase MtaB
VKQKKTVSYYTLGCKLNFSETSTISRSLKEEGYKKVAFNYGADMCIINTCSVTENADKKCRNITRKALSYNANTFIIIIGCYAQLKPEEISNIDGVDLILGANEKFEISKYIGDINKKSKSIFYNKAIKQTKEFVPGYSLGDRTRSFLKIQDGCNYFCSFCTIPLARGRSRSSDIETTVQKAKEIAAKGVKEIVLTGINIGDFGNKTDETFLDLIKELNTTKNVERFRISSIEPDLLNDDIIQFVSKTDKFASHFHIPLQSGSDKILKKMRRKYNSKLYKDKIYLIKDLMPNACIGVDVIVGFPGETEDEFNLTYKLIQELPISYLHVFTYSERDNTTAVLIKDGIVPMSIRKQRSNQLRILSEKKKREFYNSQIARTEKVLFEANNKKNCMYGFTSNYIKVEAPYNPFMTNQSTNIRLTKINENCIMKGEFIGEQIISKQETLG